MYYIVGHLLYEGYAFEFALGGNAYNTTKFGRGQGTNFRTASDVLFSSHFCYEFLLMK